MSGDWRWLASVAAVAVIVRLGFVWVFPEAVSADLSQNWQTVNALLERHENPYVLTDYLNWPPLWLQLIYLAGLLSKAGVLSFFNSIRAILVASELTVMAVLYNWLKEEVGPPSAARAVLFGIALNPISILLVVQHGNFDVIVGLWVLLATAAIAKFQESHDSLDWLSGCLFVGLGILTKTVPLVLLPLLFGGWRGHLKGREWFLGTMLALGPVVLGVSILFVLSPEHTWKDVINYRSFQGCFGITGFLGMVGRRDLWPAYSALFAVCAGIGTAVAAVAFFSANFLRRDVIILSASIALISVPVLGPGYGSQYMYWFIPLLIVCFSMINDRRLKRVIICFWAVAVLTYCFEYAVLPGHGRALGRFITSPAFERLSRMWEQPVRQTLLRLPLFASYLVLLATLIATLAGALSSSHQRVSTAKPAGRSSAPGALSP